MRKPFIDTEFYPIEQALRSYERDVRASGNAMRIALVADRTDGNYVLEYDAFADGVDDARNCRIAERLAKTILWLCGGYRLGVYGSNAVYERLRDAFSREGDRAFDVNMMETVYSRPFEVVSLESIPAQKGATKRLGGHLDGCRIGFDAGGSDRKVSAVVDGEVVYSEEVVWHPKKESDPHYHYNEIRSAFRTAAEKMPRVDAIGVSSAGIYVDNQIMVASLFLAVNKEKYGAFIRNMYRDLAAEMGNVPLVVANDGDVAALAGSMDLKDGCVLGIAMGTSEAAGYINAEGGINGWLSELAFAPVDLQQDAMHDEWSGDKGVGCKYFSQDAVIKLAAMGGYMFDDALTPAEKLKEIQQLAERGNALACHVFEDIGVYLAHTLPFYARFYELRHVMLMGRVMSGTGGNLIFETCRKVLCEEYPEMAGVELLLPGESDRRVGQSIAAASLPVLEGKN